jgi:hypothetical protein
VVACQVGLLSGADNARVLVLSSIAAVMLKRSSLMSCSVKGLHSVLAPALLLKVRHRQKCFHNIKHASLLVGKN